MGTAAAFKGFEILRPLNIAHYEFTNEPAKKAWLAIERLEQSGKDVHVLSIGEEAGFEADWNLRLCSDEAAFPHEGIVKDCRERLRACFLRRREDDLCKRRQAGEIELEEYLAGLAKLASHANADTQLTKDQIKASRMAELIELARFKGINNPPPDSAPILTNERGDVLGEKGNIIVVQGTVKSGKTGLISACIAALVGAPDDSDTLGIVAPPTPGLILHFDCEQGPRNHYRLMDTIIRKRCSSRTDPPTLESFSLLDIDLADRWPLVEAVASKFAENTPIKCVIFDGGADFLKSLNDEETAFDMVDRQYKFARKFDCLAAIVVHENPGTDMGKIRGHYGSQLHRKCQSAIVVEKGKDEISTLYASFLRDGSWPKSEATFFKYDTAKAMHIECMDPTSDRKSQKDDSKTAKLHEIAKQALIKPLTYARLLEAIAANEGCSEATARTRYREMSDQKIIKKNSDGSWQIATKG